MGQFSCIQMCDHSFCIDHHYAITLHTFLFSFLFLPLVLKRRYFFLLKMCQTALIRPVHYSVYNFRSVGQILQSFFICMESRKQHCFVYYSKNYIKKVYRHTFINNLSSVTCFGFVSLFRLDTQLWYEIYIPMS